MCANVCACVYAYSNIAIQGMHKPILWKRSLAHSEKVAVASVGVGEAVHIVVLGIAV